MKLGKPHTVTFDCWNTLIYEADESATREARRATFRRRVRDHGSEREDAALDLAFDAGWQRHVDAWSEGVASGAPEIARWALEALGHPDEGLARRLARELQQLALTQDVRVLAGARETLERLRERGVRRALICDTGFSPGAVVRRLLDRHGLLEHLEVQIFSDEVGVPKPHTEMFRAALDGLAVPAKGAVHVGDLRQTDVAGARGFGTSSVRIRWRHDDVGEDHPEADAVADSHAHLQELLGL